MSGAGDREGAAMTRTILEPTRPAAGTPDSGGPPQGVDWTRSPDAAAMFPGLAAAAARRGRPRAPGARADAQG
jgi:hypothetical protein